MSKATKQPPRNVIKSPVQRWEQDTLDFLARFNRSILASADYDQCLQTIKGHFYDRNYDAVFLAKRVGTGETSDQSHEGGGLDQLSVYAARFVPSRVLIYTRLFLDLSSCAEFGKILKEGGNVVCIGSGPGSELLAFLTCRELHSVDQQKILKIRLVDYADWSGYLRNLASLYLEHSTKSAGRERQDCWTFDQCNALTDQVSHFCDQANLVTILFTLNELFAQSKMKTMKFLRELITAMPTGCLLLVVESSGFSTLEINGKPYAIWQILDGLKGFKRLAGEDSRWYRLDKNLRYPLPLEDSRVFYRLYQRTDE